MRFAGAIFEHPVVRPGDPGLVLEHPVARPGQDPGFELYPGSGISMGIVGDQIAKGNPFGLVGQALGVKLF